MCEAVKDLYAVLGASASDSAQQLKQRYQQLVLQYHPDRLGGEGSPGTEYAGKFLEVDAAWKILRDPSSRRQYDLQQRVQELRQDWPVDRTICVEDMTWDQDERVFSHCCRCGGGFSISEDEVDEEKRRKQKHDEEAVNEEEHHGLVVCCDTCSLSVYVTWPPPTGAEVTRWLRHIHVNMRPSENWQEGPGVVEEIWFECVAHTGPSPWTLEGVSSLKVT
ncbi:dnaJ homolog subfamily C member 24 [Antennarius striatus]|uniref:dnaJ homolog subfamily C member 24 n=1 Tax=Antennarius striatus TaxID=241820 RepID=UPI0035B464CA